MTTEPTIPDSVWCDPTFQQLPEREQRELLPTIQAPTQTAACRCGRIGRCAGCCCIWPDHDRTPDKPCSLCGHTGKVAKV